MFFTSRKGGQGKRIKDRQAILVASRKVQDFGGSKEQVGQVQEKKPGQSKFGSRNQNH